MRDSEPEISKQRKVLIAAAALLALGAAGTGVAFATGIAGENDASEQVSGPGAAKARAAALEITGGASVNSVELDSENGATWEVEVAKPDGTQVDVRLDERYELVIVEDDGETPDDVEQRDEAK